MDGESAIIESESRRYDVGWDGGVSNDSASDAINASTLGRGTCHQISDVLLHSATRDCDSLDFVSAGRVDDFTLDSHSKHPTTARPTSLFTNILGSTLYVLCYRSKSRLYQL